MIGFNGGLIGKDRTTSTTAAVGVWTLNEQIKAKRTVGLWPTTGLAFRYFRWTITANRGGGTFTEAAEFNIRDGTSNINMTSATMTTTITDTFGQPIRNLIDGDVSTKLFSGAPAPPISVTINMGSIISCTGYRWFTATDTGRDPVSWTVEGSTDNTSYTLLDTKTSFATTISRNAEVGPFVF